MNAMKSGRVNKPFVAWCIGTCAKMFTSDVSSIQKKTCILLSFPTFFNKHIHVALEGFKNRFF